MSLVGNAYMGQLHAVADECNRNRLELLPEPEWNSKFYMFDDMNKLVEDLKPGRDQSFSKDIATAKAKLEQIVKNYQSLKKRDMMAQEGIKRQISIVTRFGTS